MGASRRPLNPPTPAPPPTPPIEDKRGGHPNPTTLAPPLPPPKSMECQRHRRDSESSSELAEAQHEPEFPSVPPPGFYPVSHKKWQAVAINVAMQNLATALLGINPSHVTQYLPMTLDRTGVRGVGCITGNFGKHDGFM